MTEREIKDLWKMVEAVIFSPTKAEAEPFLRELELRAASLVLKPKARLRLTEVISYAWQASGRVNDKENWGTAAKSSWHVFKGYALAPSLESTEDERF